MTEKDSPLTGMMERLSARNAGEIRAQREKLGLSQARVAELAGTSQQTVDRIERGETQASRFIPEIRRALGLQTIASDDEMRSAITRLQELHKTPVGPRRRDVWTDEQQFRLAGNLGQADATEFPPEHLPVYRVGLFDAEHSIGGEPVDFIRRPGPLMNVRDAYGVIVFSDEMAPLFRPGDVALVNPNIPPRRDNEVILRGKREWGEATVIRTLDGATPEAWLTLARDHHQIEELPRSEWPLCQVIVGKYSRV